MSKDKTAVSIRMPAELHQTLKILANAEDRSLNKQIVRALTEWLKYKKEDADHVGVTLDDLEPMWKPTNPHPYLTDGGVSIIGTISWPSSTSITVDSMSSYSAIDPAFGEEIEFTVKARGHNVRGSPSVQRLITAAREQKDLADLIKDIGEI